MVALCSHTSKAPISRRRHGHHDATAVLADYSWELGIPCVTTWSVEGHGGVVTRIVPGETGCFIA